MSTERIKKGSVRDLIDWSKRKCGYVGIHVWLVKKYGKATKCENKDCKSINPKIYEWANISGKYKKDRNDFMMLCPSCHRKKDHGNYCRRGHEYTHENTYITKEGWRTCRKCRTVSVKRMFLIT